MAYILRLIFLCFFSFSFSAFASLSKVQAWTWALNGFSSSVTYSSYNAACRGVFDAFVAQAGGGTYENEVVDGPYCRAWKIVAGERYSNQLLFPIPVMSCPAGAELSGSSGCSCLSGLVEVAGKCQLPPAPTTCTAGAPGPTFAVFTLPPFSYCNGKCTYVWSGSVGGPGVASETYTSATGASCSTVSAPPSSADSGGTGTTGTGTGTGTTGTTGTGSTVGDGCGTTTAGIACPNVGGGGSGTGTTGGTTGTGTTGGTTGTGTTGGTTGTGTTGGTTGTGTTGGTTGTGGSGGSGGGGDDPPPSDLCKDNPTAPSCSNDPCKANPDSLMCKKVNFGELQPSVVVNSEKLLTITRNQGWGPSSGSCPAPRVIYLASAGRSFEFSFKPLCDFANGIRPLVIALSWISAAFAFLRFSK